MHSWFTIHLARLRDPKYVSLASLANTLLDAKRNAAVVVRISFEETLLKIGRVASDRVKPHWALIDLVAHTTRSIAENFETWAPEAAQGHIAPRYLADEPQSLDSLRLLVPLEADARVLAVGRNYAQHLLRLGAAVPRSPTAFVKPHAAIVGPDDEIAYPATTHELDYEIELVAVLAQPLDPGITATTSFLGYTIRNDISARNASRPADGTSDLFSQKACDQTTPQGPWITTLGELGGAGQSALELRLSVNGEMRQHDSTTSMIFSLDRCLDDRVKLRAGDIVFSGTTHGVGLESGRFFEIGDVIDAEISGISRLRNRIGKGPHDLRFGRLR
jgi:2-keto-4-pentenoate hydratase/2-oxohepta-3-ene-1,7-dioic acid hydratase in catechol pathway